MGGRGRVSSRYPATTTIVVVVVVTTKFSYSRTVEEDTYGK